MMARGVAFLTGMLVLSAGVCAVAEQADVIRRPLRDNAFAIAKHGRTLGVELQIPQDDTAQRCLQQYLAIEGEWVAYRGIRTTFIAFDRLKPEVQREVLLTIYPDDRIDETGWTHVVTDSRETLWSLCEWITGRGENHKLVSQSPYNKLASNELSTGQSITVPVELLSKVMRRHTPKPVVAKTEPEMRSATPAASRRAELERESKDSTPAIPGLLAYGADADGKFAEYTMKKGDALYSSVVVRFTDFNNTQSVNDAVSLIASRNGIRDVRDIKVGQSIKIPLELLSNKYHPEGTEGRIDFELTMQEAARLAESRPTSRDLSDVVIVLDPGHGGGDHGAAHGTLYEDELNYDITCRIKALLEKETSATVYITMIDESQGFKPTEAATFKHDKDESLLTTPRYPNDLSSEVSANLRWMMANAIYDKEIKRGVDSEKIIFTSIHTDSLYNKSLRGTMIYIPGAQWRRAEEVRRNTVYKRYEEGRTQARFSSNSTERRRDEALSRNLAETVLEHLGAMRIKRHDQGDPIRSVIRRSRTVAYVPAVLRNNRIPTKILVETANLENATDRKWLADPWWRQQFAEGYVNALKSYFEKSAPTKVAHTD